MTTDSADHSHLPGHRRHHDIEELAKQQGITEPKRAEDLVNDAVFETAEELDEFVTFVRQERDHNLA
jgi:hypothetical protein